MRLSISLAGVLALGLVSLTSAPARALTVTTSFDSDLEGWSPTGVDLTYTIFPPAVTNVFLKPNPGDMVFDATGGNPGGYAKLTDAIRKPASFAQAPAPYTGDLTPFIGGTFSFDHKEFDRGLDDAGGPAPLEPYLFAIISGDIFDLNAVVFTAPAPTANTDWTHFNIKLAPTSAGGDLTFFTDLQVSTVFPDLPIGGTVGSILGRTHTKTFEQIMADVSAVLVPFELADNGGDVPTEWAGIDNIRMASAPEPAALALLLVSGALLLRRRAL